MLAVLLRTLAKENKEEASSSSSKVTSRKRGRSLGFHWPIIRAIERATLNDERDGTASDEMANHLVPSLKTPKYNVSVHRPPSQGGYEICRYNMVLYR